MDAATSLEALDIQVVPHGVSSQYRTEPCSTWDIASGPNGPSYGKEYQVVHVPRQLSALNGQLQLWTIQPYILPYTHRLHLSIASSASGTTLAGRSRSCSSNEGCNKAVEKAEETGAEGHASRWSDFRAVLPKDEADERRQKLRKQRLEPLHLILEARRQLGDP
jgi:hypothetical protein